MWAQIRTFVSMGEYCVKEGASYAPCRDYFWLAGTYAAIGIVVLGFVLFALRLWRLAAMRGASKQLTLEHLAMQLRVADETTMQRLKWRGDTVPVAVDKEQSDLTVEIRDALRARKLNG